MPVGCRPVRPGRACSCRSRRSATAKVRLAPARSTRRPRAALARRWPTRVVAAAAPLARRGRVRRRRGGRPGPRRSAPRSSGGRAAGSTARCSDGVDRARPRRLRPGHRGPRRPAARHRRSAWVADVRRASRSCPTATTTAPTWPAVPDRRGLPLRLRRRARSAATRPRPRGSGWRCGSCATRGSAGTSTCPPTCRPLAARPSTSRPACAVRTSPDLPTPARRWPSAPTPTTSSSARARTLAKWAAAGCVVTTSCCTDGSKGTWDPDEDTRRAGRHPPGRAAGRAPRRSARTGRGRVPRLASTASSSPGCASGGRWRYWIRALRPDVVLGHDPWRATGCTPTTATPASSPSTASSPPATRTSSPSTALAPPTVRRPAAVRGRRARPRRGRHADGFERQAGRAARPPQPVPLDDGHRRSTLRPTRRRCSASAPASAARPPSHGAEDAVTVELGERFRIITEL